MHPNANLPNLPAGTYVLTREHVISACACTKCGIMAPDVRVGFPIGMLCDKCYTELRNILIHNPRQTT